jgi:hypothetical protein
MTANENHSAASLSPGTDTIPKVITDHIFEPQNSHEHQIYFNRRSREARR